MQYLTDRKNSLATKMRIKLQYFSLEEESTNADQELMELYEEQTKESTAENLSSQNTESLETMLEAEDISDGMFTAPNPCCIFCSA